MIPFILSVVGGYLIADSSKKTAIFKNGGAVGKIKIKDIPNFYIYESDMFDSVDVMVPELPPNQNISVQLGYVRKLRKNKYEIKVNVIDEMDSNKKVLKFHTEQLGIFKTRDEAKEALLDSYVGTDLIPT